jgi:hypothetical protein
MRKTPLQVIVNVSGSVNDVMFKPLGVGRPHAVSPITP